MAFEAELREHAARDAGNEFREAAFDAVFNELLSGFGLPKLSFELGDGDPGFFVGHIFPLGEHPDQFGIARHGNGEGDELEGDFLFVAGVLVDGADFDFAGELGAIGHGDFDGKSFFLFVGLNGDVAIAEGLLELLGDFLDGLGVEVGEFDFFAEFVERDGAGFGFEFAFDGGIDFASQFGIVSGFGKDTLEEIQKLGFGSFGRFRCFFFFCHNKTAKTGLMLCRILRKDSRH